MRRYCWLLTTVMICFLVLPAMAAGRTIALTAADGQPLAALLDLPRGRDLHAGVILLPMYRITKESWQPLVRSLTAAGFTCLSLDLRGHGRSRYGADGTDLGVRVLARDPVLFNSMYLDAAAADRWLAENVDGLTRRAIVGASVGCSVAVQAVTRGGVRAEAVVLMTPGRDYLGVNTMEDIKSWPGTPLLILSSEEEKGRGAEAIFARLKGKGAELKLYPQTDIHGTGMFGRVPGVEEFITRWLEGKLH